MDKYLNTLYLIELECIDEGNTFGLELGEKVYVSKCDSHKYQFTKNPNLACVFYGKEDAIICAKFIYSKGDFMPRIHEIVRKIGPSVDFCLAA